MCEQSGYDITRVVGLNDLLAKHLTCSICAALMKNPVDTDCKHTFCSQCIHRWLTDHNTCPVCRRVLTIRRSTRAQLSSPTTAPELKANILAQNIINDLKYKCYTEGNGCQRAIELGQMDSHLEQCDRYLCHTCGFKWGKVVEHNCMELMRNEMNRYKQTLKDRTEVNRDIENQLKDCKRKLKVCENKCLGLENRNKRLNNNEWTEGQNWFHVREELRLDQIECFEEHIFSPYKCVQIDVKSFVRLRVRDECTDSPIPSFAVRMRTNAKFYTLLSILRQKIGYRYHNVVFKDLSGHMVSLSNTPRNRDLKDNDIIKFCLK